MKENKYILFLMMIIVPLAGELKFYPFHNTFRVSLGIPVFFFFLLWSRKIPSLLSGLLIGLSVVIFRMALDRYLITNYSITSEFILHFSALFYYLTYSALFYLIRINTLHDRPLLIGMLSVIIEISSSIIELLVRHMALGNSITFFMIEEIVLVAIIRSFFTLSFFFIIKLNQARIASEHQLKQNSHMLLLISNLFEESIQLKKTLQTTENITRDCYNLYQILLDSNEKIDLKQLSQKLLNIAGEIHEVKKDNQRIYAGLAKLISKENSNDYMTIEEIINIIVQTNRKYALSLEKDICFNLEIDTEMPLLHVYTILCIINNIVSNAVEAIEGSGIIDIEVRRNDSFAEFIIGNTGPVIPPAKRELVFSPGYTTKFDASGKPSTGMGLPYVKQLVENLYGNVYITDMYEDETSFIVRIPFDKLIQKGLTL